MVPLAGWYTAALQWFPLGTVVVLPWGKYTVPLLIPSALPGATRDLGNEDTVHQFFSLWTGD